VAVAGEFRVDVRPYSAYDDPSLPVAAWIGQGGIAGDASGGNVQMTFLFQRSDDAQISELFNLEQLAADTTAGGNHSGQMETVAMDTLAPNRLGSPEIWGLSFVSSFGRAALEMNDVSVLPLWLGSPNREEGNGGIRFTFANVDLRLFAVRIQGYMWGPRSVLASGGPRRPVGGLFGRG